MKLKRFNTYKKTNEAVDDSIQHRNEIEVMIKNMQDSIRKGDIKNSINIAQAIKNGLEDLFVHTVNKSHIVHFKGDNSGSYIKVNTSQLIAEVDFNNLVEKYNDSDELRQDLTDFENNVKDNPMGKALLGDIYEYNKVGGIGPDLTIDFSVKPEVVGENKYRIVLKNR